MNTFGIIYLEDNHAIKNNKSLYVTLTKFDEIKIFDRKFNYFCQFKVMKYK